MNKFARIVPHAPRVYPWTVVLRGCQCRSTQPTDSLSATAQATRNDRFWARG